MSSPNPPRNRRRSLALGAAGLALAGAALAPAPASAGPAGTGEPLDETLARIHEAGIPGVYGATRDGGQRWHGASGVADTSTGRPTQPQMRHRIGSVTKTFTAVGLLQQAERGTVDLDAPVAGYLPGLLPDDLGQAVTVRMLLNHTSGIGDYVLLAFPSLLEGTGDSLEEHRFREITREELVALGLQAPRTGEPGERHSYSNTNYVIAGLLLEEVTGTDAQDYLTEHVIRPAGLRHTYFPDGPRLRGPHAKMYEGLHGLLDPPRDFSVYHMSWAAEAGALVSTMDDLNTFYAALFSGELISDASLAEMMTTVPVEDATGQIVGAYGLGLYPLQLPCGTFWGHDGAVWGAGTYAFSSPDGERQASLGLTRMKYQEVTEDGELVPHPADQAASIHLVVALCGEDALSPARAATAPPVLPTPSALPAATR